MGRQTRLGVRNSGKAQAREQLIHSSNEVNRNIIINESCAHCGGGMEFLFFSDSIFFCLEV
jgi:hypothetical protein